MNENVDHALKTSHKNLHVYSARNTKCSHVDYHELKLKHIHSKVHNILKSLNIRRYLDADLRRGVYGEDREVEKGSFLN